MNKVILLLTAVVLTASISEASSKKKTAKHIKKAAPEKKLTQEAVFDGATVNGKYLIAGGAVSEVEQEKTLNDIIGGRKDFKDRLRADLANSKSTAESK